MQSLQDNHILTEPVPRLFLRYAIPSVVGLVAASSAGVIDGIFVGNYISSDALAAINLTIPLGALFFGVSMMLSIGGMVMAGKFKGEGKPEEASAIFSKTVVAVVLACLALCSAMLIWLDDLVGLLGADEVLSPLTRDYLSIFLFFEPLLVIGFCLYYFVRVDGRPNLAGFALVASALVNIFLDWLFIAHLGWGIQGAAWATGISFAVMFFIVLPHFFSHACSLRFRLRQSRWSEVGRAAINGASEFANEMSAGVTAFIFNWVMITRLGADGVAAFAVVNYILFVGLMIAYGISDSLQPLISTHYGAGMSARIRALLRVTAVALLGLGLSIISILIVAPEHIMEVFLEDDSTSVMAITQRFIQYFWPAFLFNGLNIALSAYFTAMHKPWHSATIALSRSLVLPVLFIWLLPQFLGDDGIYMAIPLAEALTLILAFTFFRFNRPQRLVGQGMTTA